MRLLIASLALCLLAPSAARAAGLRDAVSLGDGRGVPGLAEVADEKAALDPTDQKLDSRLRGPRGLGRIGRGAASWRRDGAVRVIVRVERLDDESRNALAGAGLDVVSEHAPAGLAEGWIAEGKLRAVAALDGVRFVRPIERGHNRVGQLTSGGDAASRADLARLSLGVSGRGVRVGVISDGLGELARSQASGDLPAVTVPEGCSAGAGSEGTAMLEIVHDLAPGAELLFASGISSTVGFVSALECLTAAGANVIVDDLGFFTEPYFEDGLVAQAVRAAVQAGVSYYTAAGNSAELHYEAPFRASPQSNYHDWSDGGGVDNLNAVLLPPGGSLTCVLQWDDPFGAADDDYDLTLLDANRKVVAVSNNVQNGRSDPLEFLTADNPSGTSRILSLAIERARGDARILELFCLFDAASMEHVTPTSSIFGHAALSEVVTVAAINVDDLGLDTLEAFSSQGPSYVAFPQSVSRPKPDVAAFDGVSTAVPGFRRFFGTSAAAPHVAAVAALLLERNPFLTPDEVRATLAATAVDVGPSGFDTAAGAGRVDALAAMTAVLPPQCFDDATCDDANPCTNDRCERGRCTSLPAVCDDGDPCNGIETCSVEVGGCVAGPKAPDGTPCPDGTLCNGDETCAAGVCAAGISPVCEDGDTCTSDVCSPEAGCRFPMREGVESVSCVLERGLPVCPGIALPDRVSRRFARAQRLVARSGTVAVRRTQRTLLRRAARALRSAATAAVHAGDDGRLPTECAAALNGSLGDARTRARGIVRSLR